MAEAAAANIVLVAVRWEDAERVLRALPERNGRTETRAARIARIVALSARARRFRNSDARLNIAAGLRPLSPQAGRVHQSLHASPSELDTRDVSRACVSRLAGSPRPGRTHDSRKNGSWNQPDEIQG